MFFPIKVIFYKTLMRILKIIGKMINTPKPILFVGEKSSLALCSAIAQRGTKKVLLVTDAMLVELGVIDKIKAKLTECNIDFIIYDGIKPEYSPYHEKFTIEDRSNQFVYPY